MAGTFLNSDTTPPRTYSTKEKWCVDQIRLRLPPNSRFPVAAEEAGLEPEMDTESALGWSPTYSDFLSLGDLS